MLIQEKIKRGEKQTKLYERTKHPLEFQPIVLVSDAVQAPPALTGTRHTLPPQDVSG
jgi:hypothetical protein